MNRCKVQEIAELITKGTTPTTLGFSYIDEGINFVKIESIDANGKFDKTKFAHISEECHVSLKRSKLQKNDILFSIAGAIGRTAIVSEDILPANTNQALAIIRLKKNNNDLNFIRYQLSSASVIKQTEKQKQGVAQLNLSLKDIGNLEINVPSLPEQKKIASHLDTIQSAIDNKKQQLTALDEMVKSKFVEMFGEKDFPTKNWDDVFITKTGKLDSNAMVEDGMYPFFTCAKEIFAINDYAFDQEALLLAGNNAAGKYDVKYYKGKFNAYQRTYVLSLKENWSYRLFQFQLEDKLLYLKDQSKGINTKFLTLKILQTLSFIVPPNDLQDEFTAYVEKIDSAKSIIKTQLNDLNELLESKMDFYFGE